MSELNDDLIRNRVAAALRLNGHARDFEDLEMLLDDAETEPLSEDAVARVMARVDELRDESRLTATPWGARDRQSDQQPRHQIQNPAAANALPRGSRLNVSNAYRSTLVAVVAAVFVSVGVFLTQREPAPLITHSGAANAIAQLVPPIMKAPAAAENVLLNWKPLELRVGESVQTGARERRQVVLPDGSKLSLNAGTKITVVADRRVKLLSGEVFAEVNSEPQGDRPLPFVVETPQRAVTALGTKFVVKAEQDDGSVVVTQGKVRVDEKDEVRKPTLVSAGEQLALVTLKAEAAPRASHSVRWTRDLMTTPESVIVPKNPHAGGSVQVVDPNGQEMNLSLRRFHVDVHVEDGFARTTIDQTYFNHTWQRLEGTFRFPLPADASLSRLAMYVNGKLMEGGMVERNYGRNVFEQIMHTRRDPALLEWIDGSTFQMRVFPLEPRQEKRIVLSYSQRLPSDYGRTTYRFPAGHSLEGVGEWSAEVRLKGAALPSEEKKETAKSGHPTARLAAVWQSPSHVLSESVEGSDLVLKDREKNALLDRDLVVEFEDASRAEPVTKNAGVRFTEFEQEGYRYLMVRYRPRLNGTYENETSGTKATHGTKDGKQNSSVSVVSAVPLKDGSKPDRSTQRPARHWVFLYENSADRDHVLAKTQQTIVSTLLEHVEHTDSFSVIRAGTTPELFRSKPVACSKKNVAAAVEFLKAKEPIGALDLGAALGEVERACRGKNHSIVVHVGSGIAVLGETDENTLLRKVGWASSPSVMRSSDGGTKEDKGKDGRTGSPSYVGIAVGKRWSKSFMQAAAERTRGMVTQINPDEAVAWRAFELLSTFNAPRLVDIAIECEQPGVSFLPFERQIADGQEIAAVTRLPAGASLPQRVTVRGTVIDSFNRDPLGSASEAAPGSKAEATNAESSRSKSAPKRVAVKRANDFETVFNATLEVRDVAQQASYLPRTWARLEIDRLVGLGAEEHKNAIIDLSKAMYVMSPFTSLLVLEDEAMYGQFKVDRGRKDHWAMYAAPAEIKVVSEDEPANANNEPLDAVRTKLTEQAQKWKAAREQLDTAIRERRSLTDVRTLARQVRIETAETRRLAERVRTREQTQRDSLQTLNRSVLQLRLWQHWTPQPLIPVTHYWGDNNWFDGNQWEFTNQPGLTTWRLAPNHWSMQRFGFDPQSLQYFGNVSGPSVSSDGWSKDIELYQYANTDGASANGVYQLLPIGAVNGLGTEIGYRPDLLFVAPPLGISAPGPMIDGPGPGLLRNLSIPLARHGYFYSNGNRPTVDRDDVFSLDAINLGNRWIKPSWQRPESLGFIPAFGVGSGGGSVGRFDFEDLGVSKGINRPQFAWPQPLNLNGEMPFGLNAGFIPQGRMPNGVTFSFGGDVNGDGYVPFNMHGDLIPLSISEFGSEMAGTRGSVPMKFNSRGRRIYRGRVNEFDFDTDSSFEVFMGDEFVDLSNPMSVRALAANDGWHEATRLWREPRSVKLYATVRPDLRREFVDTSDDFMVEERFIGQSFGEAHDFRYVLPYVPAANNHAAIIRDVVLKLRKRVTINRDNVLLAQVVKEVVESIGLGWSWDNGAMAAPNGNVPITVHVDNVSASECLRQILEPHGMSFIPALSGLRVVAKDDALKHRLSQAERVRPLVEYAPGLRTSHADRLAVLEAEGGEVMQPRRGTVSKEAATLIEKARARGWEAVTLRRVVAHAKSNERNGDERDVGDKGEKSSYSKSHMSQSSNKSHEFETEFKVDGAGRLVLDRTLPSGLSEQLRSDGSHLWSLYPEISLGAKRTLSRFHREELLALAPWLVPSAEDLSVEGDVTLVSEHVIRITPRPRSMGFQPVLSSGVTGHEKDTTPEAGPAATARTRTKHENALNTARAGTPCYVELEFDAEARLVERRVCVVKDDEKKPSVTTIARVTYAADGLVRVFGREKEPVVEYHFERKPIEAPEFLPQTKGLVVLPLPYRDREHMGFELVRDERTPEDIANNRNGKIHFDRLSDQQVMTLVANCFAQSDQPLLVELVKSRCMPLGDVLQDESRSRSRQTSDASAPESEVSRLRLQADATKADGQECPSSKDDGLLGYAVLLSSLHQSAAVSDLVGRFPDSALGRYLEHCEMPLLNDDLHREFVPMKSASPFIKQLCAMHNFTMNWTSGRYTSGPIASLQSTALIEQINRDWALLQNNLQPTDPHWSKPKRGPVLEDGRLPGMSVPEMLERWSLFNVMVAAIERDPPIDTSVWQHLAKLAEIFEVESALQPAVTESRVRWLAAAGRVPVELLRKHFEDQFARGTIDVLNVELRQAVVEKSGSPELWTKLVRETVLAAPHVTSGSTSEALRQDASHDHGMKKDASDEKVDARPTQAIGHSAAGKPTRSKPVSSRSLETLRKSAQTLFRIAAARRCFELGDVPLAWELFNAAIAGQSLDDDRTLLVAAFEFYRLVGDNKAAESLMPQLVQVAVHSTQPQAATTETTSAKQTAMNRKPTLSAAFWRMAADVALSVGDHDESLRRLERAFDLEFVQLPEQINVQEFENAYATLFARYDQLAPQWSARKKADVDEFAARVTKFANHWISIAPDDARASETTAKVFMKLGRWDIAWEYWTVPIAQMPDRSNVWQTLARQLDQAQRLNESDAAWSRAFRCEPTNPDLLEQQALLASKRSQRNREQALLRQIVDGHWQPRFAPTVQRAKQKLAQ